MPTEDIENGRDGRITHQAKKVIVDRDPGDEQPEPHPGIGMGHQWKRLVDDQNFINMLARKIDHNTIAKPRQMGGNLTMARAMEERMRRDMFRHS